MTIRERAKKYLEAQGLSRYEAGEVVRFASDKATADGLVDVWDYDEVNANKEELKIILTALHTFAVRWLKENVPNHWALPAMETNIRN